MTENIQNKDYLAFVLSKVREELCRNENDIDLEKVCNLLNKLEKADDPKEEIYLFTYVEGLESLGSYLLFIVKKIETGSINIENLIKNLQVDKDYIKKELVNSFKIDKLVAESFEEEARKKKEETIKETGTEGKRMVKQLFVKNKQFKVEDLDNELVTEEFNESDFTELVGSDSMKTSKDYLEGVQIDEDEEEIVFNLPESMEDVFELLHEEGEKIDREKKKINETDFDKDNDNITEEAREEKGTIKEEDVVHSEGIKLDTKEGVTLEKEAEKELKKEKEHEKEGEKMQEEITREIIDEEISKKEEELEKDSELTTEEKDSIVSSEGIEEKGTEEEHRASTEYMDFESELYLKNEYLKEKLKAILMPEKDGEETDAELKNMAESIIENSAYMEEYSCKMSFDIMAGLYEAIKITLISAVADEFEADKDSIQLLIDAVLLIESLVKGYDYEDYEKVIKGLEEIRKSISEKKREKRNIKELEKRKVEMEERISSKFEDETSREQLVRLKHDILEVEKTFNSLKGIEGEYQVYEALRRLSSIFPHLKEIVSVSKQLKHDKTAKLSEASYIFVKFLQNYRLDPFDEDIQEILRYIIYNFKLIFLDKPTKELDLLISYLNDPVKIFEQTKTKGKK